MKFIKIHPSDNVAVALEHLEAGENAIVPLKEAVGRGHKFALREIKAGENILKYGMPIGSAKQDIRPGEKVHTHNMKTRLSGILDYQYEKEDLKSRPAPEEKLFFQGFRRNDGKVGIRNHLWIVPTVGCVNRLAQNLADEVNRTLLPQGTLDRAMALTHPYGCSQLGKDHELTRLLLADFVHHPNAGAVLVVGLGCENNTAEQFKEELGDYDKERIRFLIAQDGVDEFTEGMKILKELAETAKDDKREPIPVNELVIGLKCGGSDGLSGITANALVGTFSDRLSACGGTTILSEVPEMFGAETILMNRCATRSIFDKCVDMINGFKEYFIRYKQTIYENPSPGNKDGGISTLEDKSMGCTQKAGTAQVVDVLEMGGRVEKQGLNLLSGPGNDMVATTLLTAAGAHIVLFTTGRGTPFGGVVPTLKIASNSDLATRKGHWIDFDAGRLIEDGADQNALEEEFFNLVLETANGTPVRNEVYHYEEIAIFKDGVTL